MSYAEEYKQFILSQIDKYNEECSDYGVIKYQLFPPIVCRICNKKMKLSDKNYVVCHGIDGFNGYECQGSCK